MITAEEVRHRLARLAERLEAAGAAPGLEVVAVTKGFDPTIVQVAAAAGCRRIGENYAQELVGKREAIAAADLDAVHFIGRLQTNKVRSLVGLVDVVETVDRESLVAELAKRMPGLHVLVQVDTTAEPGKGGCPVHQVPALVRRALESGLVVDGLMTVGPTEGGPDAARSGFRIVRALVDELGLEVCSMGMSADLEVAIGEGSTRVRVGTALFGERPPRA